MSLGMPGLIRSEAARDHIKRVKIFIATCSCMLADDNDNLPKAKKSVCYIWNFYNEVRGVFGSLVHLTQ
jgi:hypothetical protein